MTTPVDSCDAATPGVRDVATLSLLVQRDANGVRQLLEDHGGAVHALLKRSFSRLLDALDLDEVISLAVIRVWRTVPQFEQRHGTLRAWFFVIARNCALKFVANRRRRALVSIDDFAEALCSLSNNAADQQRLRRIADVQGCIGELPALQRHVLQADLLAQGEAATPALVLELATTAAAIHAARHRGRATLRRMLQRLGHGAGQKQGDERPARSGTELGFG